ncbi:MAG: hypothetical protein IJG50_07430 [Clostridia bacterium]|nr:hypothetical protein [Clostridia bacterium]
MKKLIISLLIFAMIIISCACGTQKSETADTAAETETKQTTETKVPDKSMSEKAASEDYSALAGTWQEGQTENVITVYENGGFMMDGTMGHYDGYLVYSEEEDENNMWAPVPRYDMYLENNEPLEGASLSFDENHPGQLVFAMGAGADLYDRAGVGNMASADDELYVQDIEYATVAYINEYSYTLEAEGPKTELIFFTDNSLKELTLLSLTFVDADEDGNIVFSTEELYTVPEFTPQDALIFETTFFGTIPNNGFSYVNEQGVKKYFTIEQSGMDGSLQLIAFTPAQ